MNAEYLQEATLVMKQWPQAIHAIKAALESMPNWILILVGGDDLIAMWYRPYAVDDAVDLIHVVNYRRWPSVAS